ncbi:MAG: F420-nonreducing hydrogenase [Deltaproteobacteria bacterium RBG_13_43_22]|nr:MAG: F420-nonreducing hydrogenase [Deltaproteobacteria bacterium RBG_13_43_22]
MSEKITINPITRLEGHGKIEIFLNDRGEVEDAYWQVTELRGFERFCIGRPAEEMTRIVPNICGVCPSAHHMAATKALDDLYGVEPTVTAKLIRQLEYNAFYIEDHYIHFFFLAAPDFVVGPDADPSERNILGVLGKVGQEVGSKVIEVRKRNREIIRLIFSKAPHPEGGLPGGVPRGISDEERKWIKATADYSVEFAQYAIKLFKDLVLENKSYLDMILSEAYSLKTYYMSLVDEHNEVTFYDGKVRIIDPKGNEYALFDPKDYTEYIGEWVEPWTYIKLNHLRKLGWKGLIEGDETSLYRVAPLARLNVADGMATPIAQKEYEHMFDILGGKPAHHTLAMHWARLICALQAAEHNQIIADAALLTSKDIRNMHFKLKKKGIGCVEAPRGTLFHHYETDDQGILTKVNLIVATQNNAAPICLSIKKAAREFIKGTEVKEGLLNRVEMAFRAYDPCLSCATHALPGRITLNINIRDQEGKIIKTVDSE